MYIGDGGEYTYIHLLGYFFLHESLFITWPKTIRHKQQVCENWRNLLP